MSSAQIFVRVLGLKASCLELISNVRPLIRSIKLHLLHFWKPSFRDLEYEISVILYFVDPLNWWFKGVNTLKGNSLQSWEPTITLTTDASYILFGGGGGVNREKIISEYWQKMRSLYVSITWVFRQCASYSCILSYIWKKQKVLIQCDNTIVVLFINKYTSPLSKGLEIVDIGKSKQHSIKS